MHRHLNAGRGKTANFASLEKKTAHASEQDRPCCAAIKVRTPVNQDEKVFRRLQRREGEA